MKTFRLDLDSVRESVDRATSAMLTAGGMKEAAAVIGIKAKIRGVKWTKKILARVATISVSVIVGMKRFPVIDVLFAID